MIWSIRAPCISFQRERVAAWKSHIERLVAQSKEPEIDRMWGAYDYVAALFLRDTIAALHSGESLSGHELALLREADQMCRNFTEPDVSGLVVHYGDPGYVAPDWWWWHRLPASGVARWEFTSWWEDDVRRAEGDASDRHGEPA